MTTHHRTFTLDMMTSKLRSASAPWRSSKASCRALNLVQEWAMIHREELLEDWRFCREKTAPARIEPLA